MKDWSAFNWGDSCLIRIDSPIRRDCLELEVKSILKSEKEMLAWRWAIVLPET